MEMARRTDDRRVVLLLATFPQATPKQVRAELTGRTAPIRARMTGDALQLVTATRLVDDPLGAAGQASGRDIRPLGALIEITGSPDTPEEDLLRPLKGFGNWFGGVFDTVQSAVAVGAVRRITRGPEGPVILTLATRKLPRLDNPQFHEYWAGTHAPLALSLMPPGAAERIAYQQLHADEDASSRAAEITGVGIGDYAGILQVRSAKTGDFLDVAAEPSFAKKIYDDELNFVEQRGMFGSFLTSDS